MVTEPNAHQAKVSVIVTACEHSGFVERSIQSVLDQSVKPWEIVLVLPESSDRTAEEALSVLQRSSFLRWIEIKPGKVGPSEARNAGLKACSGDWLAFLDGDDWWHPQKIEAQLARLEELRYRNIGLIYCGYREAWPSESGDPRLTPGPVVPWVRGRRSFHHLARGNFIAGSASSAIVAADIARSENGFDESLGYGEDWDLWRRIARRRGVDFVNEDLVYISRRTGSWSSDNPRLETDMIRHFLKWLGRGSFSFRRYLALSRQLAHLGSKKREFHSITGQLLFSSFTIRTIRKLDAAARIIRDFLRFRLERFKRSIDAATEGT